MPQRPDEEANQVLELSCLGGARFRSEVEHGAVEELELEIQNQSVEVHLGKAAGMGVDLEAAVGEYSSDHRVDTADPEAQRQDGAAGESERTEAERREIGADTGTAADYMVAEMWLGGCPEAQDTAAAYTRVIQEARFVSTI